jgi:hypothetical protein
VPKGKRYEDKEGRYRRALHRQHDMVMGWWSRADDKQTALGEVETIVKKLVHERRKAGLSIDGQVIRNLKQVREAMEKVPYVGKSWEPVRRFIRKGETHWCNGLHGKDQLENCYYNPNPV